MDAIITSLLPYILGGFLINMTAADIAAKAGLDGYYAKLLPEEKVQQKPGSSLCRRSL